MRICYLSNSAIPSSNASSIAIVKMCEALSDLNHEVLLITTNVKKINSNLFNFYNVKSKFHFKRIKFFKKFPLSFNYYLFSLISIFQSIKFKPEIYITRNFFTCFLLVILKKKIIMEIHHDLETESRIVKFLVKNFKFLKSKHVKKIIAITHGVKNEYIKNDYTIDKKILILPSGSSIRENFKFRFNKKKLNIGYFGSLYKSRGFNLIINLSKIDSNNNYFIYGDLSKLKNNKLSTKNLKISDYIAYKNVSKTLNKMDILLMPYVSSITAAGDVSDITKYTSPLKLFDYLSVGKVIICSNFEVLKEILKEKQNAIFISNYKNVFSWKMEILKLSKQPNKEYFMAKNNYLLSKTFSLKKRANLILNSINE